MASRTLTSRITHVATVLLTFVNLLWIQQPSCCCASPTQCASGTSTCCGAKSSGGDCTCCCKKSAKDSAETSCPHCSTKQSTNNDASCCVPSKVTNTASCSSGACDCETNSQQTIAPATTTSSTRASADTDAPLFALIEPRIPDLRPTENFQRHNRELTALDPPVSIRFGVWRN